MGLDNRVGLIGDGAILPAHPVNGSQYASCRLFVKTGGPHLHNTAKPGL